MRQRLDMGWVNIYIINLMGEAWSKDIASLVREWQGRDIAPMMARKNVELDTTMISRVTHPDLVQRMVEDGVMIQWGGSVISLQVGECPWDPEPVHADEGQEDDGCDHLCSPTVQQFDCSPTVQQFDLVSPFCVKR